MTNADALAVTRAEFERRARAEIDSPFNRWVAGIAFGHDPDFYERYIHWMLHGGFHNLKRALSVREPALSRAA